MSALDVPLVPCTTADLARYFLRLGTTGFGGPVALAGYMQRDLVERRRWISKDVSPEGSPGPCEAAGRHE